MLKCPKCGYQGNSLFCPMCGSRMGRVCPKCGNVEESTHEFCSKCGTRLDQGDDGAAKEGGTSVSVGDIGVMRGTIDASTNVHTTIGSQTNITGPVHVQISGEARETTAGEWLDRGMRFLQTRQYEQAVDAFVQTTQRDPDNADAFFYMALASLQGQRPKLVSLRTVHKVEGFLQTATGISSDCAHAFLLWAIVKYDAYVMNGMYDRPPTVNELVARAKSVSLPHLEAILKYVPAHGNPVWERAKAMQSEEARMK